MAHALAQLIIPHQSGEPRNSLVNVFHFRVAGNQPVLADAENIRDRLQSFYDEAGPESAAVTSFMTSALVKPLGWTLKLYDADVRPMGPPNQTLTFDVLNLSQFTPLPSEVAIVLSFRSLPAAPGEPHPLQPGAESVNVGARRRGRVYVGALSQSAMTQELASSRPTVALRSALAFAGSRLAAPAIPADPNEPVWCVYSKADDVLEPVVNGWVDDAWDTQRRRGEESSTRTNWT